MKADTPKEAADQIRKAFPRATNLQKSAECVGSTCVSKIRDAGFDLISDPTKKFPNYHRLVHPDGVNGFTPENLDRLSKAFTNTNGN